MEKCWSLKIIGAVIKLAIVDYLKYAMFKSKKTAYKQHINSIRMNGVDAERFLFKEDELEHFIDTFHITQLLNPDYVRNKVLALQKTLSRKPTFYVKKFLGAYETRD